MTGLLDRLNAVLADRYTVESEIGRGGMATVFLAEDLKHRRKVAIKVLHPELASAVGAGRFLNEVEIVAGLEHPHILTLIDSGEADGLLYYVMPYIEGESLRDRLEAEGQLSVEESVRIAVEVADGLDYAHGKGIVHRDIKPGNILLSGKHAVITDFGIARAITVAQDDRLTGTGLAIGTPRYASPEQATGAETLDGRTDIYSLGCVLYELLSGEVPLGGPTPQAIRVRRMDETPSPLHPIRPTVSPLLDQVIGKALATLPADRFESAERFAQALMVATMESTPVAQLDLASTPSLTAHPRRAARLARIPLWLLILVPAVAVGSLGAWGLVEWQASFAGGETPELARPAAAERRETQLTESGNVWPFASPVLSPDGRYLAYCESEEPVGEVVNESGMVHLRLMLGNVGSATGDTEPSMLVALQRCSALEWMPDGRSILVSGELRETSGLFRVPMTGGRIVQLSGRSPSRMALSPDGGRVAASSGSGKIGFLDIGGEELADFGDEFSLSEPFGNIRDLAWSPSGERLAVVADSAGAPALVSLAPDGTDPTSVLGVTLVAKVGWGESDETLYYSRLSRELVRVDMAEGSDAAAVPEIVASECRWFSLSRDGGRLACTGISRPTRMSLIPHDSPGDSVLLLTNESVISEPVVSPDGQRLLFIQAVPEGLDLFTLDLSDGSTRRLTFRGDAGGRAFAAAWSPDGRTIAYIASAPDGTMAPWFVPSEGGPSVRVAGVPAGMFITWAPARDPIVQTIDQTRLLVLEPPVLPWDSALARRSVISNLTLRSLASSDSFDIHSPKVSPNGQTVAVWWSKGHHLGDGLVPGVGIWLIGLADSSEVKVADWSTGQPMMFPLMWSPTGDALYFKSPGGSGVRRLSLDSHEINVPDMPHARCHPVPVPDGRFLCGAVDMKVTVRLIEGASGGAE